MQYGALNGYTINPGDIYFTSTATTNDTVVVSVHTSVPLTFGRVLGLSSVQIDTEAASQVRLGGTALLDIVIVIHRLGSMSTADLNAAKSAALSVLELFDSTYQQVALGVLGPSKTSSTCSDGGLGKPASSGGSWVPVPFSSDYSDGQGNLDNNSLLVRTINCLTTSSVGTNFESPISAAATYIQDNGRAGASKAIIFETDGSATRPSSDPCDKGSNAAQTAKTQGIEVFAIGFGIAGASCDNDDGTWSDAYTAKLLADMATDSLDDYGSCLTDAAAALENADDDHFFCEPKSSDLTLTFTQIGQQLLRHMALIC